MKKINVILIFHLFLILGITAQNNVSETIKKDFVPSRYNRNAITVIILDNKGSYVNDIKTAATKISIPEKFNDNNVDIRCLSAISNQDDINQKIEELKVANQILAKLFSRDSKSGEFDMKLIAERGIYNATADDMIKASASKIGLDRIKDAGKILVNSSYIQVLDIRNVQSMEEYYNAVDAASRKSAATYKTEFKPINRTENGWKGEVVSYLYKIDPAAIDSLYESMWIYNDDPNAIQLEKKELFEKAKFAFSFVMSVKASALGTQSNPGQSPASKKQLSRAELFQKLVDSSLSQTLFEIEAKYEPFRVKTAVYAVRPVQAKIGTKEGLTVDQRYFVFENVQNDKGQMISKRRGVVLAKKVANNSQIASAESISLSKFYQTAGRRIEAGMTMQQRNDLGLGISGGSSVYGAMGGIFGKAELNIAKLTRAFAGNSGGLKATQLKAFVSYALDGGEYAGIDCKFERIQYGLSKGFYFARNFSIAPFVAYGTERATDKDATDKSSINTAFVNAGAYATINISHNIQIVGTANYYTLFGNATDENNADLNKTYDLLFTNSDGVARKGLAVDLSLRIEL